MVFFNVEFDRPDCLYKPGETLQCIVRLNFDAPTIFRSIYVRCQGKASVWWSESNSITDSDGKSTADSTSYTAQELYFKHYETLHGSRESEDTVVQPGTTVHKVFFKLPDKDMPQAHKGSAGSIKYEVKVHMNVPWGKKDKKEIFPFHIEPRLDLNKFPHLQQTLVKETSKTFGFFCWKSEPLKIQNVIPQQGYVPGDRIQFTMQLNNDSNVPVTKASVKLVELITFHATSPSHKTETSRRTLWETEFKSSTSSSKLVQPLQKKIFTTEVFLDPTHEYKVFHGSEIITVKYVLLSTAHVAGCHANLVNPSDVTIGTIPFRVQSSAHVGVIDQPLPSYTQIVNE